MSLRISAVLAGSLGLAALAPAAAAEDCPPVKLDREASRLAVYPGGVPGRNRLDFDYIAVALGATAVCTLDDDDNVVADVTITYATQPGPLYRGKTVVEGFADANRDGAPVGRQKTAKATLNPPKDSDGVTDRIVIRGLVVGNEDNVEDGGYAIVTGLVQP
ncbi:MAG: hypothetical protein JNL56_08790 [Alphaproteobacteria bacterium]|nr:hypothetical protein [Alphaproteobacteria bacterium]